MYLSIATTHRPASDLGYLMHKHPARLHEADLSFGRAVMAYPEASEERAEFVLALDIDPVSLVRGRSGGTDGRNPLARYVDDRPYAASSFLSVAISQALGTALNGRSRERAELAATAIPLEVHVAPLPLHGKPDFVARLFEPLGWSVEVESLPGARYGTLQLRGIQRLADLLAHLCVLVPVLDGTKHYFIGPDEIDKLMRRGGDWLATHPERERIAALYLKGRRAYINEALARLDATFADIDEANEDAPTDEAAKPATPLWRHRYLAVIDVVREEGCARVADVGCAEGRLAARLAAVPSIQRVIAIDPSSRALDFASARFERLATAARDKIELAHGALGYRDKRLDAVDAVLLVEVVEHLDPERLALAMDALFASRPPLVVITTPNRDYNVLYELAPNAMRHPDHRFEWTRAEFEQWAADIALAHGYAVDLRPIGDVDADHGPPT